MGDFNKKESESLDFTGLKIPRDYFLCAEEQEGEMSQLFLNQFLVHRGFVYYELQNMDSGKYEIIKRQLKKGAKEKVIYTCKEDSSMKESGKLLTTFKTKIRMFFI